MRKTSLSRRISSAIASLSACRTVISTISTPAGRSGSAAASNFGAAGAAAAAGALSAAFSATTTGASAGSGAVLATGAASSVSPSPCTCAIGSFTFTPSVPSGIRIFTTLPLSTLSTSIVALSVSISASTSPGETVSPSLTSHLESLPSSMVGERAGMRIVGMGMLSS